MKGIVYAKLVYSSGWYSVYGLSVHYCIASIVVLKQNIHFFIKYVSVYGLNVHHFLDCNLVRFRVYICSLWARSISVCWVYTCWDVPLQICTNVKVLLLLKYIWPSVIDLSVYEKWPFLVHFCNVCFFPMGMIKAFMCPSVMECFLSTIIMNVFEAPLL